MTDLVSRRIIEALRTGVPTHHAVVALGSGQPRLESRMSELLRDVRTGAVARPSGFVFNGDFGSGKSHLLEVFAAKAIEDNFLVSRVVISKNLPLHSPMPVFLELMTSLCSKSHIEDAFLTIVNEALDRGADLSGLLSWSNDEARAGRLAPLFPALLSALRRVPIGTYAYHTIVEYLSGASVPQTELNTVFRAHAPHIRDHSGPRAPVRAAQTTRFLSRLFIELGFAGWIVLFDELELIRLQGPVSRGKAYVEIATWFGLERERRVAGLGAVGTVTRDFVSSCIEAGSYDRELVPLRLGNSPTNFHLAAPAHAGMEFLVGEQGNECSAPDHRRLKEIQRMIRGHYGAAFGGSPSELTVPNTVGAGVSMRAFIRRWITLWDLERQGRSEAIEDYEVAPALDADDAEEVSP